MKQIRKPGTWHPAMASLQSKAVRTAAHARARVGKQNVVRQRFAQALRRSRHSGSKRAGWVGWAREGGGARGLHRGP